jgi:hypothetical protein
MQTVSSSPLLIEDISERNGVVTRGFATQHQIRIRNLTSQKADVQVWIQPTDDYSEPIWQWCRFSETKLVTLQGESFQDITLTFEIPSQAKPGVYNYEILVEAPIQNPGKVIKRPQQLRVQQAEQDIAWDNVPTFTLHPLTSSSQPHLLQAGDRLEITVRVENRSKLVDRFYLICSDYPQSWYTVRYPESSLAIAGLVQETDGLQLNPGKAGEIQISFHPPQYTPAGHYCPTLRLISTNTEDLALLDIVYFQLLPDERLIVDLQPAVRKIPDDIGVFTVTLFNPGNIDRHLVIAAGDEENRFTYVADPADVTVPPGEQRLLQILARPPQWWRTLRHNKLEFFFALNLQNLDLHPSLPGTAEPLPLLEPISAAPTPVETPRQPVLPQDLPQGKIIWQPRPWLLLWLLLLALGLLGIVGVLLWQRFHKAPPPTPKVLLLQPTERVYQEGRNTPVRLDWTISHLERVQRVTVIRLDGNVEAFRKTYYFNTARPNSSQRVAIPPHLLQREGTNAPKVNNFCESTGADNKHPVLNCKGIITPTSQAGNYVFKIDVFTLPDPKASTSPETSDQPASTSVTDTITIAPPAPLPVITNFSSTVPVYQIKSSSPPTNPTPIPKPATPPPPPPVLLNWAIANPQQIRELRLVGMDANGTIVSPLRRFSMPQTGLPPELSQFCSRTPAALSCKAIPTTLQTMGTYTFQLTVVPTHIPLSESKPTPITATTPPIKIQPPPPQIKAFQINGKDVEMNPKLVYTIGRQRSPFLVTITWNVLDGEAQLLPAPGVLAPQMPPSLTLPLAVPSQTTLTLQVTNPAGQQVSRTAVIEVLEFVPPQLPSATAGGSTSGSPASSSPLPPSPPPPDSLERSPLELPPRPD